MTVMSLSCRCHCCHVVDYHRRFLYCRHWRANAVSCIVSGYHWVRLCELFLAGTSCHRLRSLSMIVVGWHIASFIVINCHYGLLRCRWLPSFLLIVADCLSLLLLLLVSVYHCFRCCWFLSIDALVVGFCLSLFLLFLVSVCCCCWFLSVVDFVVVGFCLLLLLFVSHSFHGYRLPRYRVCWIALALPPPRAHLPLPISPSSASTPDHKKRMFRIMCPYSPCDGLT